MFFELNRLGVFACGALRSLIRPALPARAAPATQIRKMSTDEKDCTDIVWVDLEMTGLDVQTDKILEVACIITDKQLKVLAEGPCFAIKHEANVYETMNEWCMKQHYESGLIDRCKSSDVTPDQAESILLKFLKQHIPERKCPLAGNTIYMDRLFLRQYMPAVDQYLHYRIIDVSTIKELATRWNTPVLQNAPRKTFTHRSLEDIKESIEELKYYKEHFFK